MAQRVPQAGRRSARGVGPPRRPRRRRLLLRPHGRPGRTRSPPSPARSRRRARGRTPSCRTTPSSPSTRSSCTSVFVGFTVPFAFAIAALVTGRLGEGWLVATRRYTLFAWAFLTDRHRPRRLVVVPGPRLGRLLGLGPGRERRPPAVALRPPPTCTRSWCRNGGGCCGSGTSRSSIAAYSLDDPRHVPHPIGRARVGALLLRLRRSGRCSSASSALVVAVGVGLIFWRGDRLRSPGTIDAPVSREGAFLVNNLLFAGFALVVLLGTVFPLLRPGLERPADHRRDGPTSTR